jgi:hypothetical protein
MAGRASFPGFFLATATFAVVMPFLTGCSGDSSSVAPTFVAAQSPEPSHGPSNLQGTATVRLTIPALAQSNSSTRRRHYVSPATGSLTLTVNGGAPNVLAIGPHSPACVDAINGARTCSFQATFPIGLNQTFSVKTFASADGSGIPLSLATVVADVLQGKNNELSFTLNGVVAGLSVKFSTASISYGVAGSATVIVDAVDAAGDTIVGPGNYVDSAGNPLSVTLTDADQSGDTKLGEGAVDSPGTGVAFNYNGAALNNATVTANLAGFSTATASIAFTCDAPASAQALYVNEGNMNSVGYAEFPLSLAGTLDGFVSSPGLLGFGLGVDRAGRVYQSEGFETSSEIIMTGISEFCPQASGARAVPYRTVVTPSSFPLALDESRDLYVYTVNQNAQPVIEEYPPDSGFLGNAPSAAPTTTPSRTIVVNSSARFVENGVLPPIGTAGDDVFITDGNAILGFSPSQAGTATAAVTIANNSAGLIAPFSTVVDTSGNVYVSYVGDWRADTPIPPTGAIAEYGPGNHTTPVRIIFGPATNISGGGTLAFDATGNIGLLRDTSLTTFGPNANGNATPATVITLHGFPTNQPSFQSWAIDPATKNLYVCSSNIGVAVFDPNGSFLGAIAPTTGGIGIANGIVFESDGSIVIQSTQNDAPTEGIAALLFYSPGTISTVAPSRIVNLGKYDVPSTISRDTFGNIYEFSRNPLSQYTMAEFAANAKPNDSPISTFFDPRAGDFAQEPIYAQGGTVDGKGNSYVFDGATNNVYFYSSGASGDNAVPQYAYGDYHASTDGVGGFATDGAGNLYVASVYSAGISVYAPGTTKPFRTIGGPHTRLAYVVTVAADDRGDIFVSNQGGYSLMMFDAAANGDVAPTRVYQELAYPGFGELAVGPASVPALASSHAALPSSASIMIGPLRFRRFACSAAFRTFAARGDSRCNGQASLL